MDIPPLPTVITIVSLWLTLKLDTSNAWVGAAWPLRLAVYAVCWALPTLLAWAIWLVVALQQCKG